VPSRPKHISRQELKKDQIRDTLQHAGEAVLQDRQLWLYVGIAALVVIAVLGWRFYSARQAAAASIQLADAMKVYNARIRAPGEAADPAEITYVDEKNKYADAARKFVAVAAQYPHTISGRTANYYAGLSLAREEKYDDAIKVLQPIESGSDEGFAALARFQLAQIDEKTGKDAQAVQLFQQLINKPTVFVSKPVALLALADHYAKSDPPQATKLYQQVKTEFPDTQAAQQADQRLQLMGAPAKG
jgi:hypothetical protein